MSEFSFIDWIRSHVTDRPPMQLGIGDDAAILSAGDKPLLVTTDMLMEGTDFTFPEATPELAGRKSLAVNLSDIAAMAGVPTAAFVSVALPRESPASAMPGPILAPVKRSPPHPSPLPHGGEGTDPANNAREFAERFFTGLIDLADEFNIIIAGGDTNTWDGPLVANITLLGHPAGKAAVTRAGAKPGDKIFVTGELGGSIHGHHLTFTPRIREAQQLIKLVDVHAMIDISDGLAADLHHILQASQVGSAIDAERIPISAAAFRDGGFQPPSRGQDAPATKTPLQRAVGDGEDFELLFTVSAADAEKLQRTWPGPTRLTCLGEVTADRACWLIDGDQKNPLPPLGWVHSL